MKVLITATPLESLTWNSTIGKVRIRFREGTDPDVEMKFLDDLITAAFQLKLRKLKALND